MKLQHISILFIIIIVPILLVLQYYIDLQSDTILLQAEYDEKLVSATKQALEAFEINTVEWNSETSDIADSLRRDINASINVFTNSMANNLGIGGASKERILSYIPAVAFTLNDGYYIYTPTYVPQVETDENGLTVKSENGNILYKTASGGTTENVNEALTEYKHVLKTFVPYQKQFENYIFNFSLDNYVKVYAKNENGDEVEIIKRSGHYDKSIDLEEIIVNTTTGEMETEVLTENIIINDGSGTFPIENYIYIYDQTGQKVYYDGTEGDGGVGNFFTVQSDGVKSYFSDSNSVEDIGYRYKTLLRVKNTEGTEYEIVYQGLNGSRKGKWYKDSNYDGYIEDTEEFFPIIEYQIYEDFSAINYYVETYTFTNWVESIVQDLNIEELNKIFDESNLTENEYKRQIIRESIETNLQLAMSTYTEYSGNEYKLPYFKETEWERIYSNISIITFFEGVPIGLKTYSNYAIETSTANNAYVSEDCLYYQNTEDDPYYHQYGCSKISEGEKTAYRNIDYIMKTFETETGNKNYYKHNIGEANSAYACYYCLVSNYDYNKLPDESIYENIKKIALAREKYANSVMIYEFNQEIEEANPYRDFLYQVWLGEKPVAGFETIQDTLKYTDDNYINTEYNVKIKSTVTEFTDSTPIAKNAGNKVTINYGNAIANYTYEGASNYVASGTLQLNTNNIININEDITLISTLSFAGVGTVKTKNINITTTPGKLNSAVGNLIVNGTLQTANSGEIFAKNNIEIISNENENNYVKATSLSSTGGAFKIADDMIESNENTAIINATEINLEGNINCSANSNLTINGYSDTQITVGSIYNNGNFTISNSADLTLSGNIENNAGIATFENTENISATTITNIGMIKFANAGNLNLNGNIENNGGTAIFESKGEETGNITATTITNTGTMTLANKGELTLSGEIERTINENVNYGNEAYNSKVKPKTTCAILNYGGTLDISNINKLKANNAYNIILAQNGSITNILPNVGETIMFTREDKTDGRAILVDNESESSNGTTEFKKRTILNIGKAEGGKGIIVSDIRLVKALGGQVNLNNVEINTTDYTIGGSYVLKAGIETSSYADRKYPRVSINNCNLNFIVEDNKTESCAILVSPETIMKMTSTELNSGTYGIKVGLWLDWDSNLRNPSDPSNGGIHQFYDPWTMDSDWWKCILDYDLQVNKRTELPVILISSSTIAADRQAIYNQLGYVQLQSTYITIPEKSVTDNKVWLNHNYGSGLAHARVRISSDCTINGTIQYEGGTVNPKPTNTNYEVWSWTDANEVAKGGTNTGVSLLDINAVNLSRY